MDETKTEFNCPFCFKWVKKTDFDNHMLYHDKRIEMSNGNVDKPKTLNELYERFSQIGLWEER